MIKKITQFIKKSGEVGIFHDSRRDIRLMAKVINDLTSKVNECIEEINKLKSEQCK